MIENKPKIKFTSYNTPLGEIQKKVEEEVKKKQTEHGEFRKKLFQYMLNFLSLNFSKKEKDYRLEDVKIFFSDFVVSEYSIDFKENEEKYSHENKREKFLINEQIFNYIKEEFDKATSIKLVCKDYYGHKIKVFYERGNIKLHKVNEKIMEEIRKSFQKEIEKLKKDIESLKCSKSWKEDELGKLQNKIDKACKKQEGK